MSDVRMSDNRNLMPPTPLSTDISDRIAARIASGDLVADDRLPSEAELAQ